ncbi:hypothetical protein FVE85_7523 [Porphyridium purpureum]|uniref:SnoaL-like domain-containing protein n=1 Tax=Porphyridium purpureum TaxID=35688 RepID=A0A5J4ZA30_PORPP|nr:hypothetical protein FVE85_7523 [Porphyridium purpureum]|eukprot:POR1233..scf295_1
MKSRRAHCDEVEMAAVASGGAAATAHSALTAADAGGDGGRVARTEGDEVARDVKANAIGLVMEAVQNGRPRDAAEAYIGAQYKEHAAGVPDGKDGFVAFHEAQHAARQGKNVEVSVLRALQEGPRVFLHLRHSQKEISTDTSEVYNTLCFFDADQSGKIVEHWSVVMPIKPPNASGRTQFDGPTEVSDPQKTAENKAIVLGFIHECLIGRAVERFPHFMNEKSYLQHDPEFGDGMATFLEFMKFADIEQTPLRYDRCHLCVAEGNFVATLSRVFWTGYEMAHADLFRVEDGKICEHWDVSELVLPADVCPNSGKF